MKCKGCGSIPAETLEQPHEWGARVYSLVQVTYTCSAVDTTLDGGEPTETIGCPIAAMEEERYNREGA
jgi:hypothetical protein